MHRLPWFVVVSLVWLVAACTSAAGPMARERLAPGLVVGADAGATDGYAGSTGRTVVGGDEDAAPAEASRWRSEEKRGKAEERLLIQRGELQIEVPRPDDAMRAFVAAAQQHGGHLQNQTGSRVVVRVPAAKFDELFEFARGQGRVLAESRSADDVTEEFVDLGIRLDNARKARERLTEILQKADKVEDILRVEAELRRLTDEIERMEGRRKFLADQVAMATLTVRYDATREAPPPPRRQKQPSRFWWVNRIDVDAMRRDF